MPQHFTRILIPLDQGLPGTFPSRTRRGRVAPQRNNHPLAPLDNTLTGMNRQFRDHGWEVNSMIRELAPGFYADANRHRRRPLKHQRNQQAKEASSSTAEGPAQQQQQTGEQQEQDESKYTLNLYLGNNFSPENVKVSLKDKAMTVEVKEEIKSKDGTSRFYQEVSRKFTLPQNIDETEVRSVLTRDGILRIEAPMPQKQALPEPPQPTVIPVEVVE